MPAELGWIVDLGALGILLLMFWMWITGKFYSKPSYDDMKEDRDKWRTVAETALTAVREHAASVDKGTEAQRALTSSVGELAGLVRRIGPTAPDRDRVG